MDEFCPNCKVLNVERERMKIILTAKSDNRDFCKVVIDGFVNKENSEV